MGNEINVSDLVMLVEAIPEQNLVLGQIGCVRKIINSGEFEVEFVKGYGRTRTEMKAQIGQEQLSILRVQITLDETDFWTFIEESKAESVGDIERQVQLLINRVSALSIPDIFAFDDLFHRFHRQAYQWNLWAAAYIIGGGCSDDGFTDFRAGLITLGKQVYDDALRDPEILADILPADEELRVERMNYAAKYAYKNKTGEEMPIFYGLHKYSEPTGEPWNESEIYKQYPKLTAKFAADM
jgi:hypothetical protein